MFLVRWAVLAFVFLVSAHFLPGIRVASFGNAFLAAIVLSLVNFFIKPALIILTLPVNILTLGLFTFVINALMILLVSVIVPGFTFTSFWWAFVLALFVTAANKLFD
jgi:putative membrane protein